MRPRYHWILLGVILVAAGAPAQEKGDKNGAAPRSDASAIEVRFADDSTVKMVLQHTAIDVTTRYGKLSVPVAELRRIEFGLRIPDESAKRIAMAIPQLGGPDFVDPLRPGDRRPGMAGASRTQRRPRSRQTGEGRSHGDHRNCARRKAAFAPIRHRGRRRLHHHRPRRCPGPAGSHSLFWRDQLEAL